MLRGGVAGVLAALLTYPITLVLAELLRTFFVGFGDLGERLLRALELTFLLLVTTGFAAMIVMGAIGMVLALFIRTSRRILLGDRAPAGAVAGNGVPRRSSC